MRLRVTLGALALSGAILTLPATVQGGLTRTAIIITPIITCITIASSIGCIRTATCITIKGMVPQTRPQRLSARRRLRTTDRGGGADVVLPRSATGLGSMS